jgi:hypothetical protein
MGFIYASSGRSRVFGYEPGDVRAKERIGFLPENFAFSRSLNPEKLLQSHLPLRARPLACLAVLLAAASPAQVQKDSKSAVQATATATVIEVPVNVIGKDGKPLPGLTAADFELYDNGKKQRITGFEAVDLQKPTTDAANPFPEAPPPAARRRWLLVFDLSYSNSTALIRAREGARSIVDKDMAPTDLVGVAMRSSTYR